MGERDQARGGVRTDGGSAGAPRHNRQFRHTRQQLMLGLGLTLVMLVLQGLGLTRPWEYGLFDVRGRWFDRFNAGPSDEVALVMIDDQSLETMGKWPWPRELMARAIDELRRAGASVIALDILFEEGQALELRRASGGEASGGGGEAKGDAGSLLPAGVVEIDHDMLLSAAMKAHGGVAQAASFNYARPRTAAERRAETNKIKRASFDGVMDAVAASGDASLEEVRARLIPEAPESGPEVDDLARKLGWARTLQLRRQDISTAVPGMEQGLPEPHRRAGANWPFSNDPSMPLPGVAFAAAQIGNVSFGGGDLDGGVRRIPMWMRVRDRLHPTLGLAACSLHLGVPIKDMLVSEDQTVIRIPAGRAGDPAAHEVVIPTHGAVLNGLRRQGALLGLAYVPWPRGGSGGWLRQFAREQEDGQLVASECQIGWLLNPTTIMFPNIKRNLAGIDRNMLFLGERFGLLDARAYAAVAKQMEALSPDEPRWRELLEQQRASWAKAGEEAAALVEMNRGVDLSTLSEAERTELANLEAAVAGWKGASAAIDAGLEGVRTLREKEFPERFKGKIVFVGWTATGAIADFARTSIDPRTPGVHVHAAMASAILSSRTNPQFVRNAPAWADALVTLLLGVLGTMSAVRLGVLSSPVVLLGACAAWFAFDGYALWDFGNWFVALAAPLGAAGAGWVSVILHRLLVEQRGRKQTEARFRSYVSPEVVDILVNDPSLSSMVPVRRELTIFFSDIAGWTTLAERLGTEGIGQFLATYLREMSDILQRNRATIDKYLGDGIMAFWGAPVADAEHARHAVTAVIQMQEALERMNADGSFGAAGAITVRIGLAAGEVNVGDFGNPPQKSSYTVIGDAANLAARLESANKQFGSLILMSDRVRTLMAQDMIMRLMGRVVVKGKTEPETLWEPLGSRRPKGDKTEAWASATTSAVEAYIAGDFALARRLFDALERDFDEPTLADLYRHSMEAVEEGGGPGEGFDGSIVLKEK